MKLGLRNADKLYMETSVNILKNLPEFFWTWCQTENVSNKALSFNFYLQSIENNHWNIKKGIRKGGFCTGIYITSVGNLSTTKLIQESQWPILMLMSKIAQLIWFVLVRCYILQNLWNIKLILLIALSRAYYGTTRITICLALNDVNLKK